MRRALLSLFLPLWFGASAAGQPLPDFQLADVNLHSPRRGGQVSPRDYRLQISAFYFGAAG
jgi:hypothetical protein